MVKEFLFTTEYTKFHRVNTDKILRIQLRSFRILVVNQMKSSIKILSLFLLLILASPAFSQKFKGAIGAGFNLSQVDGDEVYGYHRIGAHLSAAAILPINNWDITLETVFNQKGAYQKPQFDDSLTGEYDLRLNYLEIPITVHYTDKNLIGAGAGISYGQLVSFKEVEHGGIQPPYSDSVKFDNNDISAVADIYVRIWKKLRLGFRFSYSIIPIRERTFDPEWAQEPWTRKQYNNVITLRLTYIFNDELPLKKQKEKKK